MNDADALAEAARQLVGTPFRLRGRDPGSGVDCIGLVSVCLSQIGRTPPVLPRYAMRNLDFAAFARILPAVGLRPSRSAAQPGDIVLMRPSAAQYHLAIIGPSGLFIHAHAGLRRVVEGPAPPLWASIARWHLIET